MTIGVESRSFGGNVSPHLRWQAEPAGTRSFALVAADGHVLDEGASSASTASTGTRDALVALSRRFRHGV